jgi:hypothetical protein
MCAQPPLPPSGFTVVVVLVVSVWATVALEACVPDLVPLQAKAVVVALSANTAITNAIAKRDIESSKMD